MRLALVMCHLDRSMAGAVRELNFSKYLGEFGVEVEVFRMFRGGEPEEERYLGDRVRTRFFAPDKENPIPHRLVSTALADAVADYAPDVIVFKGLSYEISRFVHQRLPDTPFGFIIGGSVRDRILGSAKFVFGEYKEQLNSFFPNFVKQDRAFILPKYIDPELTRMERPEKPDYDIINVGNFHEKRKNQVDLLPFSADHKIALVGGEKMPAEWAELIPNPDNIVVLGRLQQKGVADALLRSKIMVHTSTMDGLPRSMIEGMAAGTPVIAYRSTVWGGIEEGEHGFLVDRQTLPHAIGLLLGDEKLRRKMSRRARSYAEKNHGLTGLRKAAKQFAQDLQERLLTDAPAPVEA
jgi:glycosyltransferase involved in cell wall biosynthesis